MKKLIIYLVFIFVSIYSIGQNKDWHPRIIIDNMVADDTVLQPTYAECGDIGGYGMSVTVWSTDLDTSITVSFGATNKITDSTDYTFAFESFPNDSLPYRFYMEDHQVITNNDTTYQRTFERTKPIQSSRPLLYLRKDDCISGTAYFDFLFTK